MRLNRFSGLLWLFATNFALLITAAPAAQAWVPGSCQGMLNATAFRDQLATTALLGPGNTFNLIAPCRASVPVPQQAAFDACVLRVRNYTEILARPGLGLNMTDAVFHNTYAATNLVMPPLLLDATLFTRLQDTNLSNAASVALTVARIKTLYPAAIVVPYVSPTTPSIDNTGGADRRGRIVAWIDDAANNISHYVQFSVNANSASVSGVNLGAIQRTQASVVNVKRAGAGAGTYIFDWQRTAPGVAPIAFNYNPAFGNDQKCYGCHANGVLAIHPFESGWAVPAAPLANDDVGGAAASLGPTYAAWLDPLNNLYRPDEVALNNQIAVDWGDVAGIVAEAPTPTQVVPGQTVPNALQDPSASTNCSAPQRTAVLALRPRGPLTNTQWTLDWTNFLGSGAGRFWTYRPAQGAITHNCNSCHNSTVTTQRGLMVYEPASYGNILQKYVAGGFMPPDIPAYDASGGAEVRRNTVPLATRQTATQCFEADVEARVTTWMKNTMCPP